MQENLATMDGNPSTMDGYQLTMVGNPSTMVGNQTTRLEINPAKLSKKYIVRPTLYYLKNYITK